MFCYQCEQTKRSDTLIGCAGPAGTCGKDEPTSDLQDLYIYVLQGVAEYHHRLIQRTGAVDLEAAETTLFGVFSTLTNVNFSPTRFTQFIHEAVALRTRLAQQYIAGASAEEPPLSGACRFEPAQDYEALLAQASVAAVRRDETTVGADVVGLRAMILYALKGVAAYAHHAWVLGYRSDEIDREMARLLVMLAHSPTDLDRLLAEAMATGQLNLKVMEQLDRANTETYGAQEPTTVAVTPRAGKAILVSGHDLYELHKILEATAGLGIDVYTHGELLPANAYPKLKAYPHLAGNYGGAWQNQQLEFAAFPGPIVLTSNCLIEPKPAYRQRLFTLGPVDWPGIRHLDGADFEPVLRAAKALPGFKEVPPRQTITIGFGRHALFNAAGDVVNAVKQGAIKHFFLIGGCDGAVPGRNYYTELAEQTPDDSVILTLGCGKYRFNKTDFGTIGNLPRLLDVGQCNDAYAAIQIAQALADAFECGINDLPLSLSVSWFEQKATAILLSLLALGVRGIRLGPTLPGYLTPHLLNVFQQRFDLRANGTVAQDLAEALA